MTPPPQERGVSIARSIAWSMRERPQPQLLLGDLPEAGKAVRLDDEEEDDEPAEDDELQVGHRGVRDLDSDGVRQPPRSEVEEDGKERDEGRPEEAAEDRAHAADDDHE